MMGLNHILNIFIINFYKYKIRTGIFTYFYFLKNLYFSIWISSFLFFLLFLIFAINWTFLYINQIIVISYSQVILYYFYKFLVFLNLSLLFLHLYFSLKHILLDYIRNINKELTYIYFYFFLIFLFFLFYFSYFKVCILNIDYLYIFLKNIYLILFIFFINLFFINKSIFLLLKKIYKNIKINNILYFLFIFLLVTILFILINNILYLDFNMHIKLHNFIINNMGMIRSWILCYNDFFIYVINIIFFIIINEVFFGCNWVFYMLQMHLINFWLLQTLFSKQVFLCVTEFKRYIGAMFFKLIVYPILFIFKIFSLLYYLFNNSSI